MLDSNTAKMFSGGAKEGTKIRVLNKNFKNPSNVENSVQKSMKGKEGLSPCPLLTTRLMLDVSFMF